MNNTLNATQMQLPSGTHFHKDKQKCLLLPQSGKIRMDANELLAKKIMKLNFQAKETRTWPVVHLAWQPEVGGVIASFAICISNITLCVSRHVCTSLPCFTIIPCYLHCVRSHVTWSNTHGFGWRFGNLLNHFFYQFTSPPGFPVKQWCEIVKNKTYLL